GTSSVYSAAVFQSPHEHGWKYVDLVLLFHIPFYLFLLRSVQWLSGTVPATIGFMLLLYWSYWAEHAILIGDPRYGLGVYPILVGLILPISTMRFSFFTAIRANRLSLLTRYADRLVQYQPLEHD